MKQTFLFFSLILILFITACGSNSPLPAQVLSPINVCYSAITGTQTVVWYAYENQLFQKYGLKVNLTNITSGTKAVTALLAGSVDICQVAGSAVINAVAAGQHAVMIAGLYNIYPASLMVTADITSPQDLKGRSIAISDPGSSTDVGTRMALSQLGLVPDKDVALIAVGDESVRIAAMEAGQVAGALLTSPDTLLGHEKGFVELVNLASMNIPYQHTGLASTRKYLQSHPTEATNFMKAILEAIARMKKDPEGTKAVIAKYLLLDPTKDAAALDDAYTTLILNDLADIPFPTLPGIQTIIDYLAPSNPYASQILPDQVVDVTILTSLQQSGFIAQLGK
jgi:NitT/TauT family transport system substrate-binding protein